MTTTATMEISDWVVTGYMAPEKQAEHFRNRSAAMDKSFNDEMNKLVKAEREQWKKEEREDRARRGARARLSVVLVGFGIIGRVRRRREHGGQVLLD